MNILRYVVSANYVVKQLIIPFSPINYMLWGFEAWAQLARWNNLRGERLAKRYNRQLTTSDQDFDISSMLPSRALSLFLHGLQEKEACRRGFSPCVSFVTVVRRDNLLENIVSSDYT